MKRFGVSISPEEHAVDFADLKKLLLQDEYLNTSIVSGPDLGKGKRPGIYMNRFVLYLKLRVYEKQSRNEKNINC